MAKYDIVTYCYEHQGEIVETASSKKEADTKFANAVKTAKSRLNVSSESSAIVIMVSGVGRTIKRERVE